NEVVVFGNEGKGVSDYLKKLSTVSIKFNMENSVDSFNVAISSSIIGLLLIKKI
ncbi:MAG: 23S rRNA (guanosine(2251)-2'-O)-methyltransferase RlmB, partial [Ureaplasma sp.]|nr:23S rRNA (guanosine(2251)-2'-O)-methyltransferase RlmB [Ureaplasma sp.]